MRKAAREELQEAEDPDKFHKEDGSESEGNGHRRGRGKGKGKGKKGRGRGRQPKQATNEDDDEQDTNKNDGDGRKKRVKTKDDVVKDLSKDFEDANKLEEKRSTNDPGAKEKGKKNKEPVQEKSTGKRRKVEGSEVEAIEKDEDEVTS